MTKAFINKVLLNHVVDTKKYRYRAYIVTSKYHTFNSDMRFAIKRIPIECVDTKVILNEDMWEEVWRQR
ncbi:hypothetical protein [Megamonas funiformis]|uniref:hypothetical protein n=1 Tax=Megamonas funiformis TaxID=437897 RepID=UPI003F859B9A